MRVTRLIAVGLALMLLATQGKAQDRTQTLADIRQELSVLYVDVQRLKSELNTTGGAGGVAAGGTLLDRVDALEAEVTRLTAKTEELEFRINSVVKDGTNRIGDLEFRLVELEGGDVSKLGETTTLGGGELPAAPAIAAPAQPNDATGGGQFAIAEQADFDAAQSALNGANWSEAAERFTRFIEAYPGSPMTPEANFLRGDALSKQGLISDASRAYLDAFSADPTGARAPEALLKLGAGLGELGQVNEACVTLQEVANRFPGSPAVAQAEAARQALGCP